LDCQIQAYPRRIWQSCEAIPGIAVYVKALIIANPKVAGWKALREEAQGDLGMFRYRITFFDGSLLEMFERFQIVNEKLLVVKYRLHWQDAAGRLLKRWDNAAHHPQIPTHPHHVHDGSEENIHPSEPFSAEQALAIIVNSNQ
jgi:hypothetical protein